MRISHVIQYTKNLLWNSMVNVGNQIYFYLIAYLILFIHFECIEFCADKRIRNETTNRQNQQTHEIPSISGLPHHNFIFSV